MLTTIMIIGIVILGLIACAISYSAGWNAGAKQILAEYEGLPSYRLKVEEDACPQDAAPDSPEDNVLADQPHRRDAKTRER